MFPSAVPGSWISWLFLFNLTLKTKNYAILQTKDKEKERGGALTPARPAAPHEAQAKPKCCSIA